MRPALSHVVYIQRGHGRLYGLVEFFAAIRYLVELADEPLNETPSAQIAYVDPISGEECFKPAPLLNLPPTSAFHTAQDLIQIQLNILRALAEGAVARGATVAPQGTVTVLLPSSTDGSR